MSTRREFLIATGVAGTLPALARGVSLRASADRYITETACSDTREFARCCGVEMSARDPAAALFALDEALACGAAERIVGLTRPSTRFLVEQISVRHGFTVIYEGSHRYTGGSLQHTLHCGHAFEVSSSLKAGLRSGSWPGALARTMTTAERGRGSPVRLSVTVALSPPSDSPRLLASFILAHPEA